MKDALNNLKRKMCSSIQPQDISDKEWQQFSNNCVVALPAGGEGARLKTVTESQQVHKTSFSLPDRDTMIERTIQIYRDAGLKHFVALVFHHAQSIIDILGNGSSLGVDIKYSHDPEHPIGRGGAIHNAIRNGSIPRKKNLIVHNPDDQIVNYTSCFPRDIIAGHLTGYRKGMIATAVVVNGTPYNYSAMKINQGIVNQMEMYPLIPIPTHIGVTVFSPRAYNYFMQLLT